MGIANLLENAIENYLGEIAAPMLDISVKKNKGQLCIRSQNSFEGRVRQDEKARISPQKCSTASD